MLIHLNCEHANLLQITMEDFGTYIYILLILVSIIGGLFGKSKQQKTARRMSAPESYSPEYSESEEDEDYAPGKERLRKANEEFRAVLRKHAVAYEPVEIPESDESWLAPIDRAQAKEFSESNYGTAGSVRGENRSSNSNFRPAGNLRDGIIWKTILERPNW